MNLIRNLCSEIIFLKWLPHLQGGRKFMFLPFETTKNVTSITNVLNGHCCAANSIWEELHVALQWRHNQRDCVPNRRRPDCLLNHLFRGRSKKTSKLHVTGLCEENPPVTGGFPSQRASNADIFSIWWRHHGIGIGMDPLQWIDRTNYAGLWISHTG